MTSLQLDISLSITESSAAGAGGGYDFGMLIGDPPPVANLAHAAASFGGGGDVGESGPTQGEHPKTLLGVG